MKEFNRKIALTTAITLLLSSTVFNVSTPARTIKGSTQNYSAAATSTTTTTETTTEKSPETTTFQSVSSSTRGVKKKNTATTTTVTTTEATTETTTAFDKSKYESNVEITTINTNNYTETPTDKNGNPLTGNALEAYNVVKNTFKDKWKAITEPEIKEEVIENTAEKTVKQKTFNFVNNDKFTIKRYNFNTTTEERYSETLNIPGTTFEMRYISPETNEWYMSQNVANTAKQTLYIDTDKSHLIISIPAVYTNNKFENNTQECNPDLEEAVSIVKNEDDSYSLTYTFPHSTDYVGEIWYLMSENKLADWNNANHFGVLKQELTNNRRFSWDGYYFKLPSNYIPYSETMLYRQPSNYSGASMTKYGDFLAAYDLGYVFTYTCMQNQNDLGYWYTGPKSQWLSTDFNIGANFYDTRFNTDFAVNLINAYKRYNNDEFLMAVCRYAEYFIDHATNNHYDTKNGGWLVEDYGYDYEHNRTHVSLNHQLAELNVLYTLYQTTREEKYKNLADKMLIAVEDTKDQWVLANNNLNYALYYMAETNTMVDYPYLTYNDLFETQLLYQKIYGKKNDVVQYLMDCKMEWMTANEVTGYRTE